MNDSHIGIYLTRSIRVDATWLEGLMAPAGFQLRRPETGRFWLIDEIGDTLEVDATTFERELANPEQSLAFWEREYADEYPEDVYCRVRRFKGVQVVELGDFSSSVGRAVVRAAFHAWGRLARKGVDVGLVVDLDGSSLESSNWDAVMLDGARPGKCCDLIAVHHSEFFRLASSCGSLERRVVLARRVLANESLVPLVDDAVDDGLLGE